jgi:2-polyprenyl-3-methyl-5-hydroxy-6-metoxy-1,4-benzoquinol methylase
VSATYYEEPRPDIQALVEPAGLRILDVGCGAGTLSAGLKERGAAFVAGVELEPAAAAAARARLDEVVEGSVVDRDLPWAQGSFDLIVFADVLEHLPDPDAVLDRCLQLLAPGGTAIVSVPNMRFWSVLLRMVFDRWEYTEHGVRDRTHLRFFSRRTLLRMLNSHGLQVERLRRNKRLFDDQSQIGRLGALSTRLACATIGRVAPDLMTYQYVAVARKG